jgi:hypothetical protein
MPTDPETTARLTASMKLLTNQMRALGDSLRRVALTLAFFALREVAARSDTLAANHAALVPFTPHPPAPN